MPDPTYSVVIPVHDEEGALRELHARLSSVLTELDGAAEIVLVDDGSDDASYRLMLDLHAEDPRVKLVRLSRNFGHQVAISVGIDVARGDAVIVMDADLQHPPEVIPEFVLRWREGFDVVYGVMQERRSESALKRVTASLFYRLLARLSSIDVPLAAGDFRLVDRKVADAFRGMPERNRYVRGMFSWLGFRQVGVPYVCPPRFAGSSKYTLRKMVRMARDGLLSFSDVPLRIVLKAGFVVSVAAAIFGLVGIGAKIAGKSVPGWTSLAVAVSFLGGFQLVVLGVIGEYIARIHDEVRGRPLYVVAESRGVTPPDDARPGVDVPQEDAYAGSHGSSPT